jgi:hypothetical protein
VFLVAQDFLFFLNTEYNVMVAAGIFHLLRLLPRNQISSILLFALAMNWQAA